ncbi:MAG: hypothetical protein RLZZ126_796 [Pseudomonadota bacterium]
MDEVGFINGQTRLYGIVGDPIAQVRSPEMITWEMQRRGLNSILVPLHVPEASFDAAMPHILGLANLHGLIFTIPFKTRAAALAAELGPQAQAVGAINALRRGADGRWQGEVFDGLGCVEGFRQRGLSFNGRSVMLIGLGGAGSAIAAAVAAEQPRALRIHDLDVARCQRMQAVVQRISPGTVVSVGPPRVEGIDILMNATPVGMLDDVRLPLDVAELPRQLIVFDAIVKPEQTPLLRLAERCGCTTVRGREMMRGQIAKLVDFFG